MNRRRFLTACLVLPVLSGCSATGLIGLITGQPSIGIDTDIETDVGDDKAVIGDTEDYSATFDEVEVGRDLKIDNKRLTQTTAEKVIYNERTSPFVMLLLVVGWLLPTPHGLIEMWKDYRNN